MRYATTLPLACFVAMFAYACYGAAVVGHWPYYAHPDPKELPHRVLLHVTGAFMLVGAASLVLVPPGYGVWRAVTHLREGRTPKHRRWVWIYCAGATPWFLDWVAMVSRAPWHSVISWLLD
jgi:hypothetical protein